MHQYKYGCYFFLYSCLFYPVLKLLKVGDFLVFLPQLIREVSTMHSFRCHGGSSVRADAFTVSVDGSAKYSRVFESIGKLLAVNFLSDPGRSFTFCMYFDFVVISVAVDSRLSVYGITTPVDIAASNQVPFRSGTPVTKPRPPSDRLNCRVIAMACCCLWESERERTSIIRVSDIS